MMKPPVAAWEAEYKHDRRKHRHRCRCCNRILTEGDVVIMAKVKDKTTLAIHRDCGAVRYGLSDWTWADAMAAWGTDHLIACGWRKLPRHPMTGVPTV